MELLSRKTTVLEVKKLKSSLQSVKNEETNKTSSITKNLTTDDIKLLYLGKVLDECDDVTLFELGIPSAGVTTIMHRTSCKPLGAAEICRVNDEVNEQRNVDANANGQPSCCSIQ